MSGPKKRSGKTAIPQMPSLYGELADWFHLLTAPEDYAEEAAFYKKVLLESGQIAIRSILELGSGGGNNASHLKADFQMTLVDLSPDMLRISRRLNPECEHIQGDMRHVRLNMQFDAIFIHDAVSYLNSLEDLRLAILTAFIHCREGGVALFCPDHISDTFSSSTKHGGHDKGERGLRYLEWIWDPDPNDTSYIMDMVYLLKDGKKVSCRSDRHILGLFSENTWQDVIREAGFLPRSINHSWPGYDPSLGSRMFLGMKPGAGPLTK
jgi:SAM-dependent methyltransferase